MGETKKITHKQEIKFRVAATKQDYRIFFLNSLRSLDVMSRLFCSKWWKNF